MKTHTDMVAKAERKEEMVLRLNPKRSRNNGSLAATPLQCVTPCGRFNDYPLVGSRTASSWQKKNLTLMLFDNLIGLSIVMSLI